ncbi:hypothetical protein MOQ72_26620 [Saccharopolyspora sp. K220]|uniref:hypothetical protein n=1 Tax=Saccharopolyspora soli TaxID=2926618 RepID=UPI001F5793FB|nr:hypothetical protein [Saccharopolyspora soli]MCI2421023.1 hypothetical protein [Saccharopolyspora soli]
MKTETDARRSNRAAGSHGSEQSDDPQPKRINVAVTAEMVQALQRVMDHEGVTLTEACRRLISYGDFIYRAIKDDHAEVLVKTENSTREIVLL